MQKLFFESIGQGPEIVLLHGWGFHSSIWQFVVSKLAKDFRVTVIDLPGFGRSQTLKDYNLNNIMKLLREIAPPCATWIGWSLGGLIATKFAINYPECVNKLICVASSPRFLKTDDWSGVDIAILRNFNEQLHVDYEATLQRFVVLQFYGLKLDKEKVNWLNKNLFVYGKPQVTTLIECLNILENEDLRHELINLKCPILYLLGKRDILVPASVAADLQKLHSGIQCCIMSKASHAPFISHEAEFLTEIRRFINE